MRVHATGAGSPTRRRPEGGLSAIHRLATALLEAGVLTGQSEAAMRGVAALSGDIYAERAGIALRGRGQPAAAPWSAAWPT